MTSILIDAFDLIDAAVFSGDTFVDEKNRNEIKHFIDRWSKELKLTEKLRCDFTKISVYSDHMPLEEFIECCSYNGFTDGDGCGHLATHDKCSNIEIMPSDIGNIEIPTWATHVVWDNK